MLNPRTTARFAKLLLDANVVDELQLRSLNSKMESFNWTLPRAVAELGFAEEDDAIEAIGKGLRVQTARLAHLLKDTAALKALSVDWCEKHLAFPVSLKDRVLTLAMADPTDLAVADAAAALARARVVAVLAGETQLRTAIAKLYRNVVFDPGRRPPVRRPVANEPAAAGLSARIETARDTQVKIGHTLRAVQELLAAKGLLPGR